MDLRWKKKVEILRMVILSGAHRIAREIPPGINACLDLYREAARTGDATKLRDEMAKVPDDGNDKPLWEPAWIDIWKIQATMYLDNGQFWWLLHATTIDERRPREKHIKMLDRILVELDPHIDLERDLILGPRSSLGGSAEGPLPIGWWRWFNRQPLYEIQVNKTKRPSDVVRVVPLGSPETDGYSRMPE